MGSTQKICIRTTITMKLHIISSVILSLLDSSLSQLKFGDSSSSSSSGSNSATNTKQADTDTRFFTGNEAIDGGILGLGAGLLGGAVLGGALNGGGNGCGRRRRQADGTNTKFLGALLGGGSSSCNCGRKRRQAPGEDQPGTRFFGLFGGGGNNCCDCGYNNNNSVARCQCRYDLVFHDQYGNEHGACKRADETGRRWCYTTGYGCSDARQSQRYPNNPWSYQACPGNGR